MLDLEEKYYVYVYCDTRKRCRKTIEGFKFDCEPFYVGKGKGLRMNDHLKEYKRELSKGFDNNTHRKIRKIHNIYIDRKVPKSYILIKNVNEEEAYVTENILIESIGRIEDGGTLTNYRTGGYGGGSIGEDSKDKIRKSLEVYWKENGMWNYKDNCRIPWNKGIPMTEKAKQNLRNKNIGKKTAIEVVEKISKANREDWKNRKSERWSQMQETMKRRGYVRDGVAIGKKISESKKGNVVVSETQKCQISKTLKEKYKTGEIKVWNKGIKTGIVSPRRKKIVQMDLNKNIIKIFNSVTEAGKEIGNTNSLRDSIKTQKPYKQYLFDYYNN